MAMLPPEKSITASHYSYVAHYPYGSWYRSISLAGHSRWPVDIIDDKPGTIGWH
jgi:hypothetical protein